MKTRHILLLSCLSLAASCNFLEFDETNNLKPKDNVYSYFASTKQVLTDVYSYLPSDFGAVDGSMRDCASDDGEYGSKDGTIQYFNDGSWSSVKTVDDGWTFYNGVHAANSFIAELKNVDFSRFEYNASYKKEMKQLETFEPQARVLRATFFFELARRYGDIAMPLSVLSIEEDKTIGKTAFQDVISFIADECTECAKQLPDTYKTGDFDNEVGRVTRGYALALKSKALLYAASYLHNPSMDKEKWQKAADAAWELISSDLYELDPEGVPNRPDSKEAVLVNRKGNDWTFELKNFPIRFTAGKRVTPATGSFPSQNLVDAFETVNGYAVTLTPSGFVSDDPQFDPSRPYAGRDPRFARTILADGMNFKSDIIDLKEGGRDNLPVEQGGTPTGYYLRKYIQEDATFTEGQESQMKHAWVIYRYAETLLSYAEAMYYAFGDASYKDGKYTLSALEALNQVRANAGMPAKNVSGDEFVKALRNEWRVEFAFEDHRFWDVRRWGIGSDTQRKLYGVKITEENSVKSYGSSLYENRQWRQCMNLYPYPQKKLYANPNLNPQNKGWD